MHLKLYYVGKPNAPPPKMQINLNHGEKFYLQGKLAERFSQRISISLFSFLSKEASAEIL
jgi:hypothetical protein